jgi:hypothetical protein
MVDQLFSDRERGARPRTSETVDDRVWAGIAAQIQQRIVNRSFGYGFPEQCPDHQGTTGCDSVALSMALRAEVDIDWPLNPHDLPGDQLAIWDMLEFLFEHVGAPVQGKYHTYFGHHHLSFDVEAGQHDFAASINRLLRRNGVAFELTDEGKVHRLLPEYIGEQIAQARFHTGDDQTDNMLEVACAGITAPAFDHRKAGLEKLWDAFERIKTLEPGRDKKASANAQLDRTDGGPKYRELLAAEATALTNAGNTFDIRHFEMNKELLQTAQQVDYLFFRMFAFIHLLLRASGRTS